MFSRNLFFAWQRPSRSEENGVDARKFVDAFPNARRFRWTSPLLRFITGAFSFVDFLRRDPNEHGGPYKDEKTGGGLIFWEPFTQNEQRYLSLGNVVSLV